MNTIRILIHTIELVAALCSLFTLWKYKSTPLKYFCVYLWYVVLHEAAAYFLLREGIIRFQLTNLYGFITTFFVLWMSYKYIKIKKFKNTTLILSGIALLIFLAELIFKGFKEVLFVSKTTGYLIALISLFLYIIGLFKTNSLHNPFRELFTYFLLGFTLFLIASPVILLARNMYINNMEMSINLSYIMGFIVFLMYAIFSFGFIFSKKASELEED
ncbi:hypothetical protein I597_0172 [Dokdonia donghaensis DSW-1]|nr:hypothetical protein I597_0172 [Dokdonia donghaensis DSW-1]